MRRITALSLGLLLLTGPARAQDPAPRGKTLLDYWEAAFLQGGRAGYVHTTAQELGAGKDRYIQTTVQQNLVVKRNNTVIQLRMDTGTMETAAGKVVGTFTRQYLGRNKQLDLTGTVVGNELRLTLDNTKPLKPAPWDGDVVGLFRQETLFKERQVKPGDEFEFRSFEPAINLVITLKVRVKDYETVELLGGKKERLLRVEVTPEKVQNIQFPPKTVWLDDEYVARRSEAELPELGKLALFRTTKAQAMAPAALAKLPDIGTSHHVLLNRRIARPYETRSAVYRVTVKGDEDPTTTFAQDDRQQVKNARGQSFELHLQARWGPQGEPSEEGPGAEFTQSSYFINSADPQVKALARRAVGAETDPWKKALRIEKWVHANMTNRSDEAMATADHVARSLEGDCTEYAMLTAALCRAEGIPSRTALGLIYADVARGPVFAFHMWTEVWVSGQWVPLDATLGRGYVGATHLKVTDQSWHDTRSLTPLLPVLRLLGRLGIEVVRADAAP